MPPVDEAGCNHSFFADVYIPCVGVFLGMLVHCWVSGALVLSWC